MKDSKTVGANEPSREDLNKQELYSSDRPSAGDSDEQELLDAVLRETMGHNNQSAVDLIFDVARRSEYADTTQIEAVEELVRAIMRDRFGSRKFTRRLIRRIALSLIETPEATIRIERLWQEARSSG